jgi:hypothetical protein
MKQCGFPANGIETAIESVIFYARRWR